MVKKIHRNLLITIVGVQNNFCVSHPIRVKCKMYSYIAKSHINTCTRKKQRRGLEQIKRAALKMKIQHHWKSEAKEDHQLNSVQTSDTVSYYMYQRDNVLKISHISV